MKKFLSGINLFDFFAVFAACHAIFLLFVKSKGDEVSLLLIIAAVIATIFTHLERESPDWKAAQGFVLIMFFSLLLMGYTMYIEKNLVVGSISLIVATVGSNLTPRIFPVKSTQQ